jgi:molecular chaperone GrpE
MQVVRHFVLLYFIGKIIDNLTFAANLKYMKQKQKIMTDKTENTDNFDINTDETQGGTTHLNEPLTDEPEIEKLKTEISELNDKYLRKVAEFENFRKRTIRERMELIQLAGKDVIIDLLEVLDDCDRAQKQIENTHDYNELKEGVLLVFNKLRNMMQSRGLKPMECLHQDFNPDYHEAITEIAAPSDELKGKILDEVVKGYYLNDKIIRHAKVVVGK